MTLNKFEQFFPFDSMRDSQKSAIEFAINSFEQGKKIVILELPTGVGKSAIGVTIGRYANRYFNDLLHLDPGCYVLTSQKVLQDQYIKDFSSYTRDIRSSSSYQCSFYDSHTCADSQRLLKQLGKTIAGTDFEKQCKNSCVYKQAKRDFLDSPISITNFSYYLTDSEYSKGGGANPNSTSCSKRKLLIIDECHNIEAELTKFATILISEKFAKDILGCKIPKLSTQEEVVNWVKGPYSDKLKKKITTLSKNVKENDSETFRQINLLESHQVKIDFFIEHYKFDNTVMNIIRTEGRGHRKFEFKSIEIDYLVRSMFSDSRVLMMSATIVDKDMFCKSLGVNPADVAYMTCPSPFDKKNRPIYYVPTAHMSKFESYPALIERVKQLLEIHKDEKGIIHTGNYKISNYIAEHIKSDRFLAHNSSDREKVLKQHETTNSPTVLVSPSMMEGVDLKDDLSRFQIIAKIPFPYLGDPLIKLRISKEKNWYSYVTAKSIIQSIGRSVRNENDFAITYIIDDDWVRFYENNKKFFNGDFYLNRF